MGGLEAVLTAQAARSQPKPAMSSDEPSTTSPVSTISSTSGRKRKASPPNPGEPSRKSKPPKQEDAEGRRITSPSGDDYTGLTHAGVAENNAGTCDI